MATSSPTRFLIVERPYYRQGGARFWVDQDTPGGPREGDVVEFVAGPDDDGDVMVRFGGQEYDVARESLVDVTIVLALIRTHGI